MSVWLLAQTLPAATYYVSKSGSDANTGTSTNLSFLTIQKAASVMKAGDTCYTLSGTYRETVTPANSGVSGAPITFTNYSGATVIISGADVLNVSWSVYSNSIYQASTSSSFRQLFVDGVMMNEARWPNATVNNLLNAPRSSPSSCTYTNLVDASLPNVNLLGATLHIFPNEYNNQGFAANTRQITGWNSSTKTISWSGNIFNTGAEGTLYYVYGALSLLDIPTEWCLTGGTLYLWAPDSASPTNHVVEIKTRTSAFTLDNRSYITVGGLYVFGAGISMANTTNCIVNNCNLEYVQHNTTADWTTDVPIANQVSGIGSMWENSTITYSSQDGIRCSGTNEMVTNCVIQQVDYYPGTYYAGVTAYGASSGSGGTQIVNNTLTYSGRYCVGASAPDVNIAYNNLGYGEMLTSDGGATYEYVGGGNGNFTTIHHNWAHHSWAGVYVDQNQNNYLVYRNVCYSNYIGLLFNMVTNDLVINNTAMSNTTDILFNGSSDVTVSLINNIWNSFSGAYGSTTVTDDGWYPPIGTNFVPEAGSGAINGGEQYSPYTDGYVGAAPDIGAYEVGGTYWIPGANFTPQPFPNTFALPSIITPPTSQTNYVGQTTSFTVSAASVSPLSYQWQAGTVGSGVYTNLIAGGQFSAVTNATLIIFNLALTNTADYVVVLSNSNGVVSSPLARLTVLNPAPSIITPPASQTNIVGQTATFNVNAAGLAPLYYQWRAEATGSGAYSNLISGGQYSGVTNSTLTITSLAPSNAANYVVVVTNSSGAITSAVAQLTLVTNVTSNYLSAILPDNPTSFWPLNETSGTTIHDVVGTNNGTCVNPSGIILGGPGILYGQGVITDTAVYFTNANSGYINVPYSTTLNTPQFTVEVWLNLPSFPTSGAGPDMNPLTFDNSNPQGWAFEITNPNTSSANMYGWAGHGSWTMINTGACIVGQWSYYALTYDGTNFTVYTNGVAAGSQSSSYTEVSSLHTLLMGAYNSGGTITRFYSGGMEKVAVYASALPASRIMTHYTVGKTGELPGPAAISIQPLGTNVILSWTTGYLQRSASVTGPWTYATNMTSPATIGMTNPAQFFRSTLQAPP